ncbi:Thioredoxin-like domain-containing protein [Singulisphaera sp. GP187]|uniref:thioredoxin family protein n=1 Tax=Singulisphaera sp. GP187 TaxID=1882752 RepID=UPI00092B5C74|nr:thioredoxin family protein [Singulisphaera sp. GP187]SIN72054.1 Thioredoxin-like domain-containing protein [Singulisphaera sp. GP187]
MHDLILVLSLVWSSPLGPGVLEAQPVRSALSLSARVVPPATAALKVAVPKPVAKKHSILFFTASWCPACIQMKSQTLPYISFPGHELRIIDADANPQLLQAYGVQSLPSYVVLDGTGRAYKQGVGYRDVHQFVDFLKTR